MDDGKRRGMDSIFLIGFMGVGKSAAAERLAKLLHMERIEMDQEIARQQNMSIPQIFEQFGETYFRDRESEYLRQIGQSPSCVVSCGGGIVLRPENTDYMKQHGTVIWLTAEPGTIFNRVKDSRERPVLNGNMNVEYIEHKLAERQKYYEAAADLRIRTDGKSIREICEEMIKRIDNR